MTGMAGEWDCPQCTRRCHDLSGFCPNCNEHTGLCGAGRTISIPNVQAWHYFCTEAGEVPWVFTAIPVTAAAVSSRQPRRWHLPWQRTAPARQRDKRVLFCPYHDGLARGSGSSYIKGALRGRPVGEQPAPKPPPDPATWTPGAWPSSDWPPGGWQ